MKKNDCDLWSKQSKRKVIGIFLPFLQLCVSLNLYLFIFSIKKSCPFLFGLKGLKSYLIWFNLIFFSFFFFPTCVRQSCPEVAGAWWAGKERWGCACWAKASRCSQAAARTTLGPWFAWSHLEGTLKLQGSTSLPSPCYAISSSLRVLCLLCM